MADSTTLHALQHHAKGLYPIASALALGYETDLRPNGWNIEHRWTHCYSIRKGIDEFHFRFARKPWRIVVRDGLRGNHITTLYNEVDVLQFIRKVKRM